MLPTVKKTLEKILWYAGRPRFWAHPGIRVVQKIRQPRKPRRERSEAQEWVAEEAVSKPRALEKLGFSADWLTHPSHEVLENYVEEGEKAARAADVTMGGPGAMDFLFACTLAIKPQNCVETGVAYGWSSLAILAALDINNKGRLISVDKPYPNRHNEPWVGIAVPESLRSRWELIAEPDRYGLLQALRKCSHNIDVAHYDSDKTYWGRQWAYPHIWEA